MQYEKIHQNRQNTALIPMIWQKYFLEIAKFSNTFFSPNFALSLHLSLHSFSQKNAKFLSFYVENPFSTKQACSARLRSLGYKKG